MLAVTAIKAWLDNPSNYDEGLKLFAAYSKNTFLLGMLETGPDHYNKTKLFSELEQLLANLDQVEPEQKPEILAEQKNEADQLMDQRAELKARLRFLAHNDDAKDERKLIAYEILSITSRLDNIFNTQEFYQEHGYLPTGLLEPGDDPIQLKARQTTVRTYVSKYQKAGKLEKLLHYQSELAIIDKKLESFKPES